MVMDPRLTRYTDSVNEMRFNPNQNFMNMFKLEEPFLDQSLMDLPSVPPDSGNLNTFHNTFLPSSSVSPEEDGPEDCDFSDTILTYISQMLMEEDMDEKNCMFQESSALQAAEKPFYEILGEKYPPSLEHDLLYVDNNTPPSPDQHPLYLEPNPENWVDTVSGYYSTYNSSSNSNTVDNNWVFDHDHLGEYNDLYSSQVLPAAFPVDYPLQPTPQSTLSTLSNGANYLVDGLVDSPVEISVPDLYRDSQSIWNFHKGFEEASKFLPNGANLFIGLEGNGGFPLEPNEKASGNGNGNGIVIKEESKGEREHSPNGLRGKKNVHTVDDIELEEGRSNKHSAVFDEQPVRSEMFDRVLLCNGEEGPDPATALREAVKMEATKTAQQNGNSKASNGGKSRGKKQGGKRDVVDLRTLLIHCAQAVAADDRRSASELLKQIRQHSSPFGDGNQRVAHCFADGLEARMGGNGSQVFSTLLNRKTSATDILKAYSLYLAACPFKKISNFFSNQTIMKISENATRIHIVDFGIFYGFQWPCLLQKLSQRHGGPPELRITGIDLPQPGFRPAERVEETGRRLKNYAESFGVPLKYKAIAQTWETIQLEDFEIDPDELLVVNCLYRFRNLLDETVVLDSPRNAVLSLVRKMNPALFIHGVVNGAYSAPFFITRFREALFHFSSVFDIFETNVPRESQERILLERELFGKEALNVIACEGSERLERPETYKQWQVRNMRCGFQPFPLNKEIVKKARVRVKSNYHKDFIVDQDGHWMLQGWKGRIIYAIAAWRPLHN